MVVPIKVQFKGQIFLFKNYLYSVELCAKNSSEEKNNTKNVNINVQQMWFLNL